jgi:formylmethanofuran dehydrogenase subunit C
MAIDNILIGTTPNDKTGDTLRNGAIKINSNFNELDTRTSTIISGSDQVSGSFVNKIGGDTLTGVLIISGALQISGSSEFGGNHLVKSLYHLVR